MQNQNILRFEDTPLSASVRIDIAHKKRTKLRLRAIAYNTDVSEQRGGGAKKSTVCTYHAVVFNKLSLLIMLI